nr:SDR family NAD(P)-dependent oxidoreductase [Bacilli bacterium]
MSTRKVALITGASRGLGEAMAYRFAHNDYHVIVNYRTTKEEAERVVE